MNKIKKVVIILFTVMIVILCHTIGANKHLVLASEQQSVEYKVAISLLNVRTDAGVSNPVVTQLSSGEIVSITKMKKVGTVTWGYGHANGVSGWMAMDHLIENKGFETNRVMYFKNDGTMYKGLKTEGYFYQLDQDTAVASYEKHVVNGVVWHDVSYRGYRGWVKASDLTMVSPKLSSEYVKIMHLNENENYYKTLEGQIVVVNSKLKVKEKMEQHINDMKINGAKMADFFKKFPLEIHLRDWKEIPNGGKYYTKWDGEGRENPIGIIEIGVNSQGRYSDHLMEILTIHEFGHHIGYRVAHVGGDYSEFGQYRDLTKVVTGTSNDAWKNSDSEKFADSHSEVYIDGFQNRTATGNFDTTEEKIAFRDWVIWKLNESIIE